MKFVLDGDELGLDPCTFNGKHCSYCGCHCVDKDPAAAAWMEAQVPR